jgi:hypothetical protein
MPQRRRENDVCTSRSLPGFNLGRLVCLFRSKFLFSYYLLIPVLFSISCQVTCKKRPYNTGQVFPDELVWTFNKFFLEKDVYFGILKSELCCIIWNKYNSCRYCLRPKILNALVCSLFNQVCQLFSINMASVLILVKFNTVYDILSPGRGY